MKNPDLLWLDVCKRFSEQSQCKSRHVGCILIKNGHLIGQGWNGAAEGSSCASCTRKKCLGLTTVSGEDMESAICCHSEMNCIGYCARFGIATEGAVLYCTVFPCSECAKLLIACGIKEIVYNEEYPHMAMANKYFENGKVKVRKFNI